MIYIRHGHFRPRTALAAGASAAASFAKPKVLAMDYRSSGAEFVGGTAFDADALTLHKKYKYHILNMQPSQAAVGATGYNFVQALIADDPTRLIGQYTIVSQQYDSDAGAPTYSPVYTGLNAGDVNGRSYWAVDAAGNKTKTTVAQSYPTYELNICPGFTLANASGLKASEIVADGLKTMLYTNLWNAGMRMFFMDNVWMNPGGFTSNGGTTKSYPGGTVITSPTHPDGTFTVGDYNYDGVNDTRDNTWAGRNSTLNVEWRKGLAAYITRFQSNFPGIVAMCNADADMTNDATWGNSCLMTAEMTGKAAFGFIEGLLSDATSDASSPGAFRGNFLNVMNRVATQDDNSTMGAVVSSYVKSTSDGVGRTLQKGRMILGVALLNDCWASISDRLSGSSNMRPYWIDENAVPIGTPVTTVRPSAATAGFDGCWSLEYTNGMVIVNPSENKGRWMANGPVVTLTRASNVVTLKMPTANTPSGLIVGTNVRIQDCSNNTFNGVWTVTGKTTSGSNQLITWSQTAANVTEFTPTTGYWGIQASIDLTGLGYKRFLTTQDTHDNYNGTPGVNTNSTTSQHDGTIVTVLKLWPNDAVILLKS